MRKLLSTLFNRSATDDAASKNLAQIIAEIPNHIAAAIVVRSRSGQLEYLNSYIEVLTGHARREFEHSSSDLLRDLLHDKDRQLYDRCIAVASSGEQFEQTVRLNHQTGIELFAEIRAVPIFNASGEVSAVMLVLLNVTGNIRYQQTIEEKNRDLADFTLMLSHDLKAPVHSIKGLIAIAAEGVRADNEDAKEALHLISNATSRLDRLINGVLEYSRISESEVEMVPVDLAGVIRECLDGFAVQLQAANCRPQVASVPNVRGDRLRLTQIFSNLISNSIKYRDPSRSLMLEICAEVSGAMVRVSLKDNGTGIPAAKLGEVFRPFQRAHGAHIEGAGIGLALVKRLATRLGGDATISSTQGHGTTVSILLQGVSPGRKAEDLPYSS